jgi:tetratricopeptide (TPR) repeat protein
VVERKPLIHTESQPEFVEEQVEASTPQVNSVNNARVWVLRVALTIFLPLLLIGLGEAVLRIFGVGFSTDVTVPCTVRGHPASCYNLFFTAPFFPPGMIKMPQMYAIPAEKPARTFRIFVLGESAAMGDPEPAYGFSRYLEVMLGEHYPSMNFEVVNTGSVAINSHVLLPIAEGLAKYRPDLFIIYSGNNEVVGPYGPGTALTPTRMSLPIIRANIFYRSTRIGQLLTRVGTQKKEWGGMAMFLDKQVRESSPLMKYVYSNFEHNLRETIKAAQTTGAKVIVSTVATNLEDCAPFGSLHREGLAPEALRSWSALVQQGAEQENAGSYAEALKSYFAATAIDDQYAELEFRIARCLKALGNHDAAKEHFRRSRDLDTLRFRADSRINQINRSVASSSSGVALVDADEIFAMASPNGVTGSELIYEHVHLTPQGSYLLARAMFRQIANQLPLDDGRPLREENIPSQVECERLLAFTQFDHARVTSEMLRRLQEAPFTNQLNHSDQLLRLMTKAGSSDESPNNTAAQYEWAIGKRPNDRILHFNYGVFLNQYDPASAAQQFDVARPCDGFPLVTPDGSVH